MAVRFSASQHSVGSEPSHCLLQYSKPSSSLESSVTVYSLNSISVIQLQSITERGSPLAGSLSTSSPLMYGSPLFGLSG